MGTASSPIICTHMIDEHLACVSPMDAALSFALASQKVLKVYMVLGRPSKGYLIYKAWPIWGFCYRVQVKVYKDCIYYKIYAYVVSHCNIVANMVTQYKIIAKPVNQYKV
jgi:uncharacterized membrane protein